MNARWFFVGIFTFSTSFAQDDIRALAVPLHSEINSTSEGIFIDRDAPLLMFVDFVQQQDWDRARILANELLEVFEGVPTFDMHYGLLLMHEQNYEAAIRYFEAVLPLESNQFFIRYELGRAYFLTVQYERAESELLKVLAFNPAPSLKAKINTMLSAIEKQRRSLDITNRLKLSLLTGWDSHSVGNATSQIDLATNVLGTAISSSNKAPFRALYGQWSVNYALIKPTANMGSQELQVDYSTKVYANTDHPNLHTFGIGGHLFNQHVNKRFTLPILAQLEVSDRRLSQLTLSASYQVDLLTWGPLWVGANIGTQPTISFTDEATNMVKDTVGVRLSATERGLDHIFQSQYMQITLAGDENTADEWRAMVNRYQLSWEPQPTLVVASQLEHQWRIYKAVTEVPSGSSSSTVLLRRQDQVIRLNNQLNWQLNDWFHSTTNVLIEWQDSNMNAYEHNRFAVSQAFGARF
ncbi:tetratricopeptide repeat protein [Reinekea sp.]|uniref:tetratricopeptide repeat protein n=1 Tax=Reinekea sp. TaxID=1970455 RepID=UPI003988ED84